MNELINKLNQYRSMGDKFYPEDILVIEDVWKLLDEIERLNNIINELEKTLDENVELTYVHYGKRQCNKILTEGGLLFRDYIKSKLHELKGDDKSER